MPPGIWTRLAAAIINKVMQSFVQRSGKTNRRDTRKNMGKKSIVITIIEEKLSPYGFHYTKYQGGRWTFSREVEGISQNVFIHKGMWGDNEYLLEISTSASPTPLRIRDFVKSSIYHTDFLEFHGEDERKKVLELIGDIVIRYGIDKLNELNVMEEHCEITTEMHIKLFEEHESLINKFMDEYGLSDMTEDDVVPVLREEWESMLEIEYEQARNKLVELAAVYGTLLINRMGGIWEYSSKYKTTSIHKIPLFVSYPILEIIVELWEKKESGLIIKKYGNDVMYFLRWVTNCRQAYGPDWQPPTLTK